MYNSQISDKKIHVMADEAARCIAPELLEKGKELQYHNRVKFAKVFGPRIYSNVDDGKMYTVTIHIDDFPQSTCTCAKKNLCEHIAAVFFLFYDPWLLSDGALAKRFSAAGPKTSPKKARARVLSPVPEPVMEGPVERWHEYFEREYDRVKVSKKKFFQAYLDYLPDELYFSASLFDDFISAVSVHSTTWPALNKALYRLHSNLFFMARLERQQTKDKPSYVDSFQIEEIADSFIQAFTATMAYKHQENCQPFFQKPVEVVRECLFQGNATLFDWLWLYRHMCVTLFDNSERREKETAYLEGLMTGLKKNQKGYYYAAQGLASLKMAAGRSDAALDILQNLTEKRIEDMLFYLDHLAGVKEWQQLLAWLRWLAPGVKEAHPFVLEEICSHCILAVKNISSGEEFIKLVKSWLPRSFDHYAGYLLEAGLFREWAELIISYREYTWENIDKKFLRHVESKAPAVLIPLYHQWTAGLIEEKNRKSYQEAVKVLKKLRALYNKQKAAGEWQTFISRLASRYPRLRALQEELRKGKLIS